MENGLQTIIRLGCFLVGASIHKTVQNASGAADTRVQGGLSALQEVVITEHDQFLFSQQGFRQTKRSLPLVS